MATGSSLTQNYSRSQRWHEGTLNNRPATSHLVRLVEGEERWEASDPPECSPSKLGLESRQIILLPLITSNFGFVDSVQAFLISTLPVIEKVNKITEIIEVDGHVSSRSIAQVLKMEHKIVLSHLSKVGFKKELDVWVLHQLTPKIMTDRISISEVLAKRNEIDPFLKRMVTGDEKWVTYDNIV
ncbi:histone-lysine N-methyltransferase SETMAR [Trichonephila clavipes]|nr:histone-lysine N-methyltransferase SETMAR [Trichonephila clavipes]